MTKRQLEKRIRKAFENATPGRAISTPTEPLLSDRQDWKGAVKPVKKVKTPIQFRAIGALAAAVALVMLVTGVLILPHGNTGPAASAPQNQTSPSDNFSDTALLDYVSLIYDNCDVLGPRNEIESLDNEVDHWNGTYYRVTLEGDEWEHTYLVNADGTMAYDQPRDVLMKDILAAVNYPGDLNNLPHAFEQKWILTEDRVLLAVAIATEDSATGYLLTPDLQILQTHPLVTLPPILTEIFGEEFQQLAELGKLDIEFELSGGFYFDIELVDGDDTSEWLYDAVTGKPITAVHSYHKKIDAYIRENNITMPNGNYNFDIHMSVYFPEHGTLTVVTYKHKDADYLFCFDGDELKFHRVIYKTYAELPIDTTGPAPTTGNTEGPPVTTGGTQPAEMNKNKALDIAMGYIGITNQDIADYSVTVDKADEPDEVDHYDIWILTFDCLYEFEISAEDGTILDYEKESLDTATPPDGRITGDQALKIALDYLGITAVENHEITVDRESNDLYYDISFIHDGYEYEFEVGLYGGQGILSWEKEPLEAPPTPPDGKFTEDQALQVIIDYLGINAEMIENLEIDTELDEDVPYYDITFIFMDHEFEFEISLYGGRILSVDAPEVDD